MIRDIMKYLLKERPVGSKNNMDINRTILQISK